MKKRIKQVAVLLAAGVILAGMPAASHLVSAYDIVRYADEEYEEPDYSEFDDFGADPEAENNDGDDTYISNNGTTFRIPRVSDPDERVFDYAGIFTKEQQAALRGEIAKLQTAKNADVVLLVTYDVPDDRYGGSETSGKYMRQFYIDNGFREDGAGFIIDLNNRVLWSVGKGKYYTDDFVSFSEKVYNDALSAARKGDYYEAAQVFLKDLNQYQNLLYRLIPTVTSLIISLVLSLLAVLTLNTIHKGTQPSRATRPGIPLQRFRTTCHDEKYLGTTVTRRRIPKADPPPSSGGGFSGGHSSGGFSKSGGKLLRRRRKVLIAAVISIFQ